MSRIRSIKPEYWTSGQVMECSRDARLLFIGLWNFCDDAGHFPNSPKQIKALVFPGDDDLTADDVRRMIDELAANGLLTIYSVEGKEFLQINGWKHQKIDKPQLPKYPAPIVDHSTNDQRMVSTERIGEDRKGSDNAAPLARTREELDGIEHACREAAGLVRSPSPGLMILAPIIGLLDGGADLQADILPALRAKPNPRVASWGYFVGQIRDFRAQRLAASEPVRPGTGPPGNSRPPPRKSAMQIAAERNARDARKSYEHPDDPITIDLAANPA